MNHVGFTVCTQVDHSLATHNLTVTLLASTVHVSVGISQHILSAEASVGISQHSVACVSADASKAEGAGFGKGIPGK